MSIDVAAIMEGSGGLVIPVLVPNSAETIGALTNIANAVDGIGEKTEKAAKKTEGLGDATQRSIASMAHGYNEVSEFVERFASQINAAIDGITSLATEQSRLSAASSQLGLDFDQAAGAAGKFADETSAMQAASAFAARDVRLTQQELDSLARVAGHAAQVLGTTADEEMAKLTDALISGRERALAPYGSALVEAAGNSHTLGERLAALTSTAATTETATDNATDAMNRFRDSIDDAKRTIASAATNEFMRLNNLASPIDDAADSTARWNQNLTALGETAGNISARALQGIGALVSGVALIAIAAGRAAGAVTGISRALPGFGGGSAVAAVDRAQGRGAAVEQGAADDIEAFFRARVAALNALSDETDGRTSAPAPTGGADMVFSAEEAAGAAANDNARRRRSGGGGGGDSDARTRLQRLLDRAVSGASAAERDRSRGVTLRGELEGVFRGVGEITPPGEDQSSSKGGRLDGEREVGSSAESRFSDFAKDRDDRRRADRERRSFEQRYEHARTFTERWEELHQRQVSATEEAAGAMDNALGALGTSLAKHFESIVKGQETVGEALKGILTDTLDAIAKESFTKGGFYAAEAIAKLVMYDFPGAATAAAASAAYFAAGATATGLGAAVSGGGSAPAAPAGGGSAPRSERTSGAANDNASSTGQTVVNHFYAPVIGGRTATNAEVGAGMNRYTDATERRQVRARG